MTDSSSESPFRKLGSSGSPRRGSSSGSGKRGRILPPIFDPDDVVANRYRIVKFVGRGGMGEVYEADDLDLQVRVALKTVRPEIADHDIALERFRREIQLARKVTHPNVCRIYDVGHHHIAASELREEREVVFLTMELVEGQTLAQRIKEKGRFDEATARSIVEQMAAAIDAAHDAGIVHRDFKSSNVILSEDSKEPGRVRAVVTDFGLARGILPGDSLTTSLSSSSQALGTPTYMAPEQVAGSEITQAVDIYALGVVVFEMMTGRPPFVSDTPLSTAVKRLTEPPPSPRSLAPDLNTRWETGILRCLERDPGSRFPRARDLVHWIEGTRTSPVASSAWRSNRSLIAGTIFVLVLAIAGGVLWFREPSPKPTETVVQTAVRRPLAAVIGFRDLTGRGETAWLSTALQEMLSMELAASEEVRVVPGDIVARVRRELEIDELSSLSTDQIDRIARSLGADIVFLGSYFVEQDTEDSEIRINVRAHRTGAQEMISPVIETGKRSELLDLVSRTGEMVRSKLGFAEQGLDTSTALNASYPLDPEATRHYANGLDALRRGDPITAHRAIEESIRIESDNPLAYSALSSSWSLLGYDARARDAAKRAMELSEDLPREERLLIEARYHEAALHWDEAVTIYRRLWNIAPDNIEYGLALARSQANAGDSSALETIAKLQDLAEGPYHPRIDLTEARVAEALSDFERERRAARRAADHAREMEAWVLLARAKLAEWWAERNLGNLEDAKRVSSEALLFARKAGDRSLIARALNAIATTKRQLGESDEARQLDLESLQVFREIGDKKRESWALNNLGRDAYEHGDFPNALRRYSDSLELAREIEDSSGISRALGNIGNVYFEQGRLEDSEEAFREMLRIARQTGDRRTLPWALTNLGGTLADSGELAEGQRLLEEALHRFLDTGEKRGEAWTLSRRGEIHLYRNELEQAEGSMREALSIFEDIHDRRAASWTRTRLAQMLRARGKPEEALAELDRALALQQELNDRYAEAFTYLSGSRAALDSGDANRALELASRAVTMFDTLEIPNRKAEALADLALARLAAGNPDGAAEAIDQAEQSLENPENERLSLQIEVAKSTVAAASSSRPTRAQLDELRRRTDDMGYADLASRVQSIIDSLGRS